MESNSRAHCGKFLPRIAANVNFKMGYRYARICHRVVSPKDRVKLPERETCRIHWYNATWRRSHDVTDTSHTSWRHVSRRTTSAHQTGCRALIGLLKRRLGRECISSINVMRDAELTYSHV